METSTWCQMLGLRSYLKGFLLTRTIAKLLLDLAGDLERCEITLTVAGRLNQINHEEQMMKIFLRSCWQKRVQEIRADGRDLNLEDL